MHEEFTEGLSHRVKIVSCTRVRRDMATLQANASKWFVVAETTPEHLGKENSL